MDIIEAPANTPRYPVTRQALIARINRKLKSELQQLKTTRGERCRLDLGDYYVVDFNRNFIVDHHVDVEALARREGVMHEREELIDG